MLVLARQRGESIVIGDDVVLTVVDIRGDKVRLGISAPKSTSVHRKEVYDAIRDENRASAQLHPADVAAVAGSSTVPAAERRPLMRIAPSDNGDHAPNTTPVASHDPFLLAAIDEARKSLAEGGLPIGSALVRDGKIIAAGHDRRVQHNDPLAHAEIDCLTKAGRQKTYKDTTLYSTLMPCYLCSGAIVQFGIPKVIVGESVTAPGAPDFLRKHAVDVTDLRDKTCIDLTSAFIRDHPDLWRDDLAK